MSPTTVSSASLQESQENRERPEAYLAADRSGSLWIRVAPAHVFPSDGGACVKIGSLQIAVFHFARRGTWYACQNLCPHRREMALSRGILGSADGVPKIACPFHKATFSLESGLCLNAELEPIRIYPVRVEDGYVFVDLFSELSHGALDR
jgi:nitrite reductase (NADH) small subunit